MLLRPRGESGLATSLPPRTVWDSGGGQRGQATPGAKPEGAGSSSSSAAAGLILVLGASSSLVDLSWLRRPRVGESLPLATLTPSFRQEWGLGKSMGLVWEAASVSSSHPEVAMALWLQVGYTEGSRRAKNVNLACAR